MRRRMHAQAIMSDAWLCHNCKRMADASSLSTYLTLGGTNISALSNAALFALRVGHRPWKGRVQITIHTR